MHRCRALSRLPAHDGHHHHRCCCCYFLAGITGVAPLPTTSTVARMRRRIKRDGSTFAETAAVNAPLKRSRGGLPVLPIQYDNESHPSYCAHVEVRLEQPVALTTQTPPGMSLPPPKKPPPRNWEWIYGQIEDMRKDGGAPVDTLGCERLFDPAAAEHVKRFHILVALMMSSQTKDQITAAAHERLRAQLPGGLTVDSILAVPEDTLVSILYGVGFYRRKAEYLKGAAKLCKDKHNGDIPATLEGLLELPGVGPKMAYLVMGCAWNKPHTGIGVDVHVHRITNRLGWVKTKNPEETRKALEDWLPFEKYHSINYLLVGLGQTICKPVSPACDKCLCRDMCPKIGTRSKD
ncbi:mitochondrial endonuclease III-like protein [Andalucia godoyi]|uniref:Endonuclease III homolog n=1 Tax=Andalucia godoyi TaxID=505711 RepID=A0A8K0AHH1_ANDGO|nr:mitochondrial endonuclease III-like protein [Andalucia godoyi]|eukprot:ANDGO_00812.mRNA.1 mitochondrial endonuclease III-like protein